MKRRKFTTTIVSGLALSSMPLASSFSYDKKREKPLTTSKNILTIDGLQLKLLSQVNPTENNDNKQFILTYKVESSTKVLEDKIYSLQHESGEIKPVYMTVVDDNHLQAVFNTRLNA